MRNYKTQAFVNYIKLLPRKAYWSEWILAYGWQWVKPYFVLKKLLKAETVKIYNLNDICRVRKMTMELGKFDEKWFQRIFEPETKGVRAWEYGLLLDQLNKIKLKNKNILDVGSGGSLMPDYLESKGAVVTSLDLEKRMENRLASKNNRIKLITGDMTKMPFKDKTFDVVICISVIEHLDNKKDFWGATTVALEEMKRVLKPGGMIFLTTDFYLPEQKNDSWEGSKDTIRGAFGWDKMEKIAEIIKVKINTNVLRKQLVDDKNRANFRGRYFTTVFLIGTK
jgi:ubiquinone/menaquinone biosynthesis C-methylase UbiE